MSIIKVKKTRNNIYTLGEIIENCIFKQEIEKSKTGIRYAIFICKCGNEFKSEISKIKNRSTISCGCIKNKKHGLTKTSEYITWSNMKARCYNSSNKDYFNYGGRGIKVCDRWLESFENFLEDMGKRPEENYSLDRIKVNEDYSKENCRWTTAEEQANNRQNTRIIKYQGMNLSIREWANKLNLNYEVLKRRYDMGWNHSDILNIPIKSKL